MIVRVVSVLSTFRRWYSCKLQFRGERREPESTRGLACGRNFDWNNARDNTTLIDKIVRYMRSCHVATNYWRCVLLKVVLSIARVVPFASFSAQSPFETPISLHKVFLKSERRSSLVESLKMQQLIGSNSNTTWLITKTPDFLVIRV